MDTPVTSIETLFEKVETYGKTSYELSKLKLLEASIAVSTTLISRISVIFIGLLFIGVVSVGIALLLGDVLGKSYYGFFIVAGFYLLAAIILHFFLHKWIRKPISELIITQALQ